MSTEAIPAVARPRERRRPGVGTVYVWELRKLLAQKRTYIGLGASVVVPLMFVIGLAAASDDGGGSSPMEFERYVRETGLAVPLFGMVLSSIWLFPLIVALVAGDIMATEDQNGTLKTILTRSVERWHVFVGKLLAALTYTLVALAGFVGVGLLVGGLVWGFDPLTTLSGTRVDVGHGLVLIGASMLAYFIPLAAVAAIALMLSTLTHNSAAAVVGALMFSILLQVLGAISALDFLDPYLLTTQFDAWHGLLRDPADWAPVVRSVWVSALYGLPALGWAFTAFLRRDVTGG